jgi:hypothetical protein
LELWVTSVVFGCSLDFHIWLDAFLGYIDAIWGVPVSYSDLESITLAFIVAKTQANPIETYYFLYAALAEGLLSY